MRLAVLGSTRGTHLHALVAAEQQGLFAAKIALVLSNKKDAGILTAAASYGLAHECLQGSHFDREVYDQALTTCLVKHQIDLVVLIGYMRILSARFVKQWQYKIINVHPSLLPAFAGKMDLAVHDAVLAEGLAETGCTVHYVTEAVDQGPILLQKTCQVEVNDTPLSLKSRVQTLEGQALIEVIANLAQAVPQSRIARQ